MAETNTIFIEKLEKRLRFIYPEKFSTKITNEIVDVINSYSKVTARANKWDENDIVLITYGDSIKTKNEIPLKSLKAFLDTNLKSQLTIVHILPFFPYSSDDGFSVIDFREVDPELGNWEDVKSLTENYDLMVDLVINHASSKSKWFANFLKQEGKEASYFVTENPKTDLSKVTRPRNSPLLTPYETTDGIKHVWTTFSADQVDLDFSNPELLIEMIDILLAYISKGARIIRLDAIAFLWKKAGTSCLHLPETHEVVKLLRDVAEKINPSVIILTETNVPNKENLSYFGNNDEAHMVYQFSLPPLLLHALHTANSRYLSKWAKSLPEIEKGCTFFNFTASHDGIGVRPLEGLLPENEKAELVENMQKFGGLVNYKANTDGTSSPYELNITYFDALKGTRNGLDKFQVERFLASQIIMMSFIGVPAFYIHSLTATPNYLEGVAQTKQNRTINRRKWDLVDLNNILTSNTAQNRVFNTLKNLIVIRKNQKAFHPEAKQEILDVGNEMFGFVRTSETGQKIVVLVNFKNKKNLFQLSSEYSEFTFDLISNKEIQNTELNAYQCLWLTNNNSLA